MKLEEQEGFRPITIVIETPQERDELLAVFDNAHGHGGHLEGLYHMLDQSQILDRREGRL